jgi:DNA-binding transcriptional regulator YiaG
MRRPVSPPDYRNDAVLLYAAFMAKSIDQKLAASKHKQFVGQQLMLAREAIGHSQTSLAREYGMKAPNKLNQWERGLYYPDPWFLKMFADDYGFTTDYFYRGVRAGVSAERADDLRRAAAGKVAA